MPWTRVARRGWLLGIKSCTGAGERTDLGVVRARFSNLGDCTLREHLAVY